MDFKTGYEEIESIRSQTSHSTYLTLIDWLNNIDPKEEENKFLRNEFIEFLKDSSEEELLEKRIEELSDLAENEPDYFEENYLDGKSLRDWTLSKTIDLHSTSIDFNVISIFFKNFFKNRIKKNVESEIDNDPFLPLTGLFLLKALDEINSIKECSETSKELKGLIIHELFGYQNNEDFLNEIKKANKLEKDIDIDCDFYLVNKTLANDFHWGDRAKVFISKKLFERQGLTYPNPEELDDERMEELLLDPDEFDEPMYELVFDFWTYCDTEERVEESDILNYYGIEKRFLHPLSDYRFL